MTPLEREIQVKEDENATKFCQKILKYKQFLLKKLLSNCLKQELQQSLNISET